MRGDAGCTGHPARSGGLQGGRGGVTSWRPGQVVLSKDGVEEVAKGPHAKGGVVLRQRGSITGAAGEVASSCVRRATVTLCLVTKAVKSLMMVRLVVRMSITSRSYSRKENVRMTCVRVLLCACPNVHVSVSVC